LYGVGRYGMGRKYCEFSFSEDSGDYNDEQAVLAFMCQWADATEVKLLYKDVETLTSDLYEGRYIAEVKGRLFPFFGSEKYPPELLESFRSDEEQNG